MLLAFALVFGGTLLLFSVGIWIWSRGFSTTVRVSLLVIATAVVSFAIVSAVVSFAILALPTTGAEMPLEAPPTATPVGPEGNYKSVGPERVYRSVTPEEVYSARSPSESSILEAAVDALPMGQVLFQHPAEMEVKKAETLRVRISQSVLEDLAHGLEAGGVKEQDRIPVSASMRVSLFGEPYFVVKPLSEEEQIVAKKGFSEWAFTVIPQKRGKWPLHLQVSAVIHAPWGGDKFRTYPVKDEVIQVKVTFWGAVGDFVADNWQWLWTTVLVPVGLWGLTRFRRRRKAGTEPPPQKRESTAA